MADQKLSQLTQATTPLSGTEQVYVVQSSTSKRTTAQQVANLAPGTDLAFTQSTRLLSSSTGAGVTLPQATDALPGLMAAADKLKLDGVAAGATANSSDATLLARANHTGTQPASTISDSTAVGRALLTAADASAQRTALGLGSLATQSGTFSGTSSGTNTGDITLAASVADVLGLNGQEVTADDPGADRLVFWDDSAGKLTHLTLGTNLSISGTTLDAAGVADGDKGDITVSASGATWTVDNDAITYAKLQNVSATDRLLGRSSSGAGDVEEITCTAAGRAILDDVDAAAQRTTLGAAASGAVTSSGLTMATARLLGRSTASTGAVEEITLGSNLSYSGTTLNAAGSTNASDLTTGTLADARLSAKVMAAVNVTLWSNFR